MPQRSQSQAGADDGKAAGSEGDHEAGLGVVRQVACEVHRGLDGRGVYLDGDDRVRQGKGEAYTGVCISRFEQVERDWRTYGPPPAIRAISISRSTANRSSPSTSKASDR
jgi:hypothetical protein